MAALKPEIIKDAYHLIALYQRNPAFRERFDLAIRRNINVTYKHRPIKLYFEILASSNKAKFGESYKAISRLVKHDNEGIIQKTMLRVTTRDFLDLNLHSRKAEKGENTTDYPETEINKINEAEKSAKNSTEKVKRHAERLNKTEYLAIAKKKEEPEESKEPVEKPANQEEKAAFLAPLNRGESRTTKPKVLEKNSESILTRPTGPSGEPIRNIRQEKQPIIYREESPQEIQEMFEPNSSISPGPSLPQIPNVGGFSKNIFRGGEAMESAGVRMAGKAATSSIAKGASSTLMRTGAKAGAGALARLGVAAGAGAATGGIGTAVVLAATFAGSLKRLFKELTIASIAAVLLLVFMSMEKEGMGKNVWLPPYKIGEAATLPTAAPTGTKAPTPSVPTETPVPGGVTPRCPVPSGAISCGSTGHGNTICPGGHCGTGYSEPATCESFPATKFGVDLPAPGGSSVLIPTILDPNTKTVKNLTCLFDYQEPTDKNDPNNIKQRINGFKCSIDGDTASPSNTIFIQFHHLTNYIPSGSLHTGSVAGHVYSNAESWKDHTHIQIGLNAKCMGGAGKPPCVVPEEYLQCN